MSKKELKAGSGVEGPGFFAEIIRASFDYNLRICQ